MKSRFNAIFYPRKSEVNKNGKVTIMAKIYLTETNESNNFLLDDDLVRLLYGLLLFKELEGIIIKNKYDKIILYSTLGSFEFYRKNDYIQKSFKVIELSDGNYLCGFEMEKTIACNGTVGK